jgi:hypothetical protein
MLQTPSRSMMAIGTAPHAARYSVARFTFGAFASMGNVDNDIRGRRQKECGNRRVYQAVKKGLPEIAATKELPIPRRFNPEPKEVPRSVAPLRPPGYRAV